MTADNWISIQIARRSELQVVADRFTEASDGVLALAIARYRPDALAMVCRRHAGVVFGLARRLLVDRALAEEVVQDVFLRRREVEP